MNNLQKFSLTLVRLVLGCFYFYAGFSKITNPDWSAAGYLTSAKSFTGFYQWLASPAILPFMNFVNEWGLTLLGVSLILGAFVRYSTIAGMLLMIMYYLPISNFPYPNPNAFIIDQHIIYIAMLFMLFNFKAGTIFGLDQKISKLLRRKRN